MVALQRKFNGKMFMRVATGLTKTEAKKISKRIENRGNLYRITFSEGNISTQRQGERYTGGYVVWERHW